MPSSLAAADGQRLDALAALQLAQRCLAGPPTRPRRLVLRLCLDALRDGRALTAETASDLGELATLLDLLATLAHCAGFLAALTLLAFWLRCLPACNHPTAERAGEREMKSHGCTYHTSTRLLQHHDGG